MTRSTCATCKAFDGSDSRNNLGVCRLHPPQMQILQGQEYSEDWALWPRVHPEIDWCLEHIPAIDPDKLPAVMGE